MLCLVGPDILVMHNVSLNVMPTTLTGLNLLVGPNISNVSFKLSIVGADNQCWSPSRAQISPMSALHFRTGGPLSTAFDVKKELCPAAYMHLTMKSCNDKFQTPNRPFHSRQ